MTQNTLELADYLAAFRRRRRLLAVFALPIVAAAAALAIGLPDIFVSTAEISFKDSAVSGSLPTDKAGGARAYLDLYVGGLANAVLSRPVLAQLLQQMPQLARPGETQEQAIEHVIDSTTVEPVRMSVLDPNSGRQRLIIATFKVSFGSRDPRTAHQVASWLTNAFLGGSRAGMLARASAAAQFYDREVRRHRAQIAQLEGKLASFKERHAGELPELTKLNVIVMDQIQRDLDATGEQLSQLEVQRQFLLGQTQQARTAGTDPGLALQLQAQYERKLSMYGPNHPDMLSLRAQIDALRADGGAARIEDVASATTVQLRTQLRALQTQMAGLRQREQELRAKAASTGVLLAATPETEREYDDLMRDLELARAKFRELSDSRAHFQLTEAAIASGRSDELEVMHAPDSPSRPSRPKRLLIAGVGAALALVVAFTVMVVGEILDRTVRGSRDVRMLLDTLPIASIPPIIGKPALWRARRRMAAAAGGVLLGCCALVVAVRSLY